MFERMLRHLVARDYVRQPDVGVACGVRTGGGTSARWCPAGGAGATGSTGRTYPRRRGGGGGGGGGGNGGGNNGSNSSNGGSSSAEQYVAPPAAPARPAGVQRAGGAGLRAAERIMRRGTMRRDILPRGMIRRGWHGWEPGRYGQGYGQGYAPGYRRDIMRRGTRGTTTGITTTRITPMSSSSITSPAIRDMGTGIRGTTTGTARVQLQRVSAAELPGVWVWISAAVLQLPVGGKKSVPGTATVLAGPGDMLCLTYIRRRRCRT